MPLLVDAYNVLHVVGVLPPDLAGIDLEELSILISGSRFGSEETVLVCDGVPKPHSVEETGRIHVRFAGPGVTADELIVRMVAGSSAPRRLTVVTSDREIAVKARRRRASIISSEAFLEAVAADRRDRPSNDQAASVPASSDAMPRRQVEAWLELFGIDETLLDVDPGSEARSVAASTGEDANGPVRDRPDATAPPSPAPASDSAESPRILDAEHLDELRAEDVDALDMDRLLGDAGEFPASPPPSTDPDRG